MAIFRSRHNDKHTGAQHGWHSQLHDEGMVDGEQDALFAVHVLQLLEPKDVRDLHDLEGAHVQRSLVLA